MKWTKFILPVLLLAAAVVAFLYLRPSAETAKTTIREKVKRGPFEVTVIATGELNAKRSKSILGPNMRIANVYNTTITDIVPEGTIVEEGEFVASLDRTELSGKLKELASNIDQVESQLLQAKLDTAIQLRELRDGLINQRFSMEEKKLELEQSKYEPPAVIRRVELDLERIQRDYDQSLSNYELKREQAEARVQEIEAQLSSTQARYQISADIADDFRITAPQAGMVIYRRSWNGKQGPGTQISAWNPVVAELPDLSDMISKTYVNEVDISKIKEGQKVRLKVDAFPENGYSGKVLKVANIGEELPNFDAKVFEVTIQVNEQDSLLRPAMSTSNDIVTAVYDSVTYIPLEAVAGDDSLTYVFKEKANGSIVKQEIIAGIANSNHIIIKEGLNPEEVILLSIPENPEEISVERLPKEVREAHERRLQQEAEARKAKQRQQSAQQLKGGDKEAVMKVMQSLGQ